MTLAEWPDLKAECDEGHGKKTPLRSHTVQDGAMHMTNTPRPSCVRIWKAPTNYWCITHQRIQNRSSSKMQMRETQSTAQMTNTVSKDWLQHNFKRISAQTHPAFLGSPSSRRGIWLAIFREYGDLCISAQHRLSGGGVLERTWPLWIYYSGRKVLESPPRNPHLYRELS